LPQCEPALADADRDLAKPLRRPAGRVDDARVHPAVAALSLDEKGFVLGAALGAVSAEVASAQLGGAAGARCAAALGALAAGPKPARVAAIAELIALVRAPVPAGIERIDAGWLRERLLPQTAPTIRAVVAPLPEAVRAVAEEILNARVDEPDGPDLECDADGLADLQRAVFGGLVPMDGPLGPRGHARELVAMPTAALEETIARYGADATGAARRGAPGPVIAGAGDGPTSAEACFAAGLTVVERLLGAAPDGGEAAVLAVAQRLPPETGRRLLDAAGLEAPWVAS